MRETVKTERAPAAVGPYAQAIKISGQTMVFCSGQIPLDPNTGEVVGENAGEQTQRVMDNLRAVLAAAGADLGAVVKVTIYLADMRDFAAVNDMYATYFHQDPPARATLQAARLPKDVKIEIDAIAVL